MLAHNLHTLFFVFFFFLDACTHTLLINMLGGKESHTRGNSHTCWHTTCCFSLIYWHSHFIFFSCNRSKESHNCSVNCDIFSLFPLSLFSPCYIHSSAADSISTLFSLPLTTLITYYTSVYSLRGNPSLPSSSPSSPAVPHQVSVSLRPDLVCVLNSPLFSSLS